GRNGTHVTEREPLRRLRLRLTVWYAVTFAVILAMLGGGLYLTMRTLVQRHLDSSLRDAAEILAKAAQIREIESATAKGKVVDAVDELRIPDRALYLFDTAGTLIKPDSAPPWVRAAASEAARSGEVTHDFHHPGHPEGFRIFATRFKLENGAPRIAAVVADQIELDDQYASLIAAFSGAAAVALLLIAAGGWFLARKSTRPVEASMDQMSRFIADAAHELRTPTAVIRTRADIALQQKRDVAGYQAALTTISADSARLGRIIEDLLTLARADAGQRPIERKPVYLDDIALDAAESLRVIAAAKGVNIEIDTFDEAQIEGDAALLRQLVVILLDNAIKYTPTGKTVHVSVRSADGRVELGVIDEGEGIAAEQMPHVFERFFRGDPARTRTPGTGINEGVGLGLSIAKWIADAHGATISLESTRGAGTRATMSMPLKAASSFS
ncbi:MAG TPA: HAMP domain-containing sensor histidine kinase, partial [Vicinamibacterales bacterium]